MMNIPPTGPNKQRAKFFEEIANSFSFLAIYNSLSAARQQQLLEFVMKLEAEQLMEDK
jgi:hypothetical protein